MNGGVLAFRVIPSPELMTLTRMLARKLTPVTDGSNVWDRDPDQKWFHVTVANRLPAAQADTILNELTEKSVPVPATHPQMAGMPVQRFLHTIRSLFRNTPDVPGIRHPVICDEGLRIRVMNDEQIIGDYDLTTRTWLHGEAAAQDSTARQHMLRRYRIFRGMEIREPETHMADERFVISDLHFGHANIIRYCGRPFSAHIEGEMDRVLIRNWNCTVGTENRVYYVGDLRYGRGARPAKEYLTQLSGRITLIKGNHDSELPGTIDFLEIECGGIPLLLVHNPDDAPHGTNRWVVHGHMHNNDLRDYPFINFRRKTVNVSAELAGYRPVGLHEIVRLIRSGTKEGSGKNILMRPPCPMCCGSADDPGRERPA
jgi:calcineurin-like phosphoesterase family protein